MAEGIFYTLGLKTGGFTGPLDAARGLVGRFEGSIAGMAAKAAALAAPVIGVGAAFVGLKKAITAAADMETTVARFESLTGSAAKAHEVLSRLKTLGAETPFEFPELADAASKLIAFGEAADRTPDTLRRIGDVASGVQAPIGEIAEIYGKARVAGTLFAEDINQLTGRGIPVIQQFAKMLGVTEAEVKKLGSEGQITFPLLEQAFKNVTAEGGQFYGMMAKQSATTNGLISTLQDNLGEIFRIVGEPINDFLRPMLTDAIDKVGRLGTGMSAFFKLLQAAKAQGKFGEFLGDSLLLGALKSVNAFSSGIRGSVAYLSTTLPAILSSASESLVGQRFVLIVQSVFGAAGDVLRASVRGAAADFLDATGQWMDARQWRKMAAADDDRAASRMQTALATISGMSGEEFADLGQRFAEAHSAGMAAFHDAASGDLINTSLIEDRLKAMGQALDPDAWQKLSEAWNGTTQTLQNSAPKIDKAVTDFKAALVPPKEDKSTKGLQDAIDPEVMERRRRRLLNAEDSRWARLARRSEHDRALDPTGLGRGVFGPAIPQLQPGIDRGRLDRLNNRALDEMGRSRRAGNPRPTKPPRELTDAQSRSEKLLTDIKVILSKAIPG